MTHVTASFTQSAFRLRNDDGSQTAATWIAATNTNASIAVDTVFRVRIAVLETAGGRKANQSLPLEYSLNGGGFTAVSTSTPVQATASAFVSDGAATTQQITTGTFVAGQFDSNASVANVSFAGNDRTEMEYCLRLDPAQINNGDTVALRVTGLASYSQTPTITAVEPVSVVGETGTFTLTGQDAGLRAARRLTAEADRKRSCRERV